MTFFFCSPQIFYALELIPSFLLLYPALGLPFLATTSGWNANLISFILFFSPRTPRSPEWPNGDTARKRSTVSSEVGSTPIPRPKGQKRTMENRHRMDVAELDDRDCEGSVCEGNEPNLDGDKLNVVLLTLLCTLQGIPMGISLAISTYMQNMKVSYVQQVRRRRVAIDQNVAGLKIYPDKNLLFSTI